MDASPLLQEFNPGSAAIIVLWILAWGVIGGVVTPRIYRRKDLDASNALLYGALAGAGTGPILLAYLWIKTPELTWPFAIIPAMMAKAATGKMSSNEAMKWAAGELAAIG